MRKEPKKLKYRGAFLKKKKTKMTNDASPEKKASQRKTTSKH